MKSIIFRLLIVSFTAYDTNKAISYARTYCKEYNKAYLKYDSDSSNFVSQCLKAGGQDLNGCTGLDSKGSFQKVANLRTCLSTKKWKYQQGLPKQFKPGYPFFNGNSNAMIATAISGKTVTYCGHTNDRCDAKIENDNYFYYYL